MLSIKLGLDGYGAEDIGQYCNAESEENTILKNILMYIFLT